MPLRRDLDRGRNPNVFSGAGIRLLAVDDNPVGLTVLRHVLKRHGMNVDCASSGTEALDLAAQNRATIWC